MPRIHTLYRRVFDEDAPRDLQVYYSRGNQHKPDEYVLFRRCTDPTHDDENDGDRVVSITVTPGEWWAWKSGKMVQEAFARVPANDREMFFQTGICGVCWDKMFLMDDEDDAPVDGHWRDAVED